MVRGRHNPDGDVIFIDGTVGRKFVEGGKHLVEINPTAHDVIGPRENGCQVGAHRQRGGELLVEDLPRLASANGKIGVVNPIVRPRDVLREAIGPPAIAARTIRIIQSLADQQETAEALDAGRFFQDAFLFDGTLRGLQLVLEVEQLLFVRHVHRDHFRFRRSLR